MSLRLPSIDGGSATGTLVLHETARRYEWSGSAPFSLKWFPTGEAMYEVGGAVVRLDRSRALVVGDGTDYRISIDGEETESLCLFFERALVTDVDRSLCFTHADLLDDPSVPPASFSTELVRSWPINGRLQQLMPSLRRMLHHEEPDPELLLELVSDVVSSIRRLAYRIEMELEQLPAVKSSTRRELYRRLHIAREYILASFREPLTVRKIARASMLSPTHLIRNFRSLFGATPRQFLIRVRLNHARELLRRGNHSVTETCLAVGYESVGSFSTRYKSVFGIAPADDRRSRTCLNELDVPPEPEFDATV